MVVDPNAHDESQEEQPPAEIVALNYIDKVYASVSKQWDAMSRTLTIQTIVSVITLAVCLGAVTPQEKFSLLGLGLVASISTVLIGTSFTIATLHIMTFSSWTRARETAYILPKLYGKLGNHDADKMSTSFQDPFGGTSPLWTLVLMFSLGEPAHSKFARFYLNAIGITTVAAVALVLPVVAELAALVRVAALKGWGENFLWAILLIPIVSSVACDIWTWEVANTDSPTAGE